MSDRNKAIDIINSLPDSQVAYVLSMLQIFHSAMDEASDDAFCEKLYADYLNDDDSEKDTGMLIEDFAQQLGISIWNIK